jgi:hypothetical protein
MFMRGLLLRMGRQVESNWGLDYIILLKILLGLETELDTETTSALRKRDIAMMGSYLVVCFVCALRGNEGFLLESEGVQQMIQVGNNETDPVLAHVTIPLLGRFKNEDGEKWHIMVAVNKTDSGIDVRRWIERLVRVL